jgi:xanthine dehydrogenase accessory factor
MNPICGVTPHGWSSPWRGASQLSDLFGVASRWSLERRPFVMVTVIDTGGSTPRLVGAQMLISADLSWGTIGGGAIEYHVEAEAHTLLRDLSSPETQTVQAHLVHDLGMCCGGKMTLFLKRHTPPPRAWIFGAGHIGQALAWHLDRVGFEVIVIDERSEWTESDRFAQGVEVRCEEPEEELNLHPPAAEDYVVVTTHDHGLDERLIATLLTLELTFLGLIGSAGKWGRFQKRLRARGVEPSTSSRVRCPVGLNIGAHTPEEIAISIVAELIQIRRT